MDDGMKTTEVTILCDDEVLVLFTTAQIQGTYAHALGQLTAAT